MRIDAYFPGRHGPLFPPAIIELQRMGIHPPHFNGDELKCFLTAVPGPGGSVVGVQRKFRTTDGYHWYIGILFENKAFLGLLTLGSALILLPWAQDFDLSDGTQFDRHVALYVRGSVPADWIEDKVRAFIKVIENVYNITLSAAQTAPV